MKLLRLEGGASDLDRMAEHFGGASLFPVGSQPKLAAKRRRVAFNNSIVAGTANFMSLGDGVEMTVSDLRSRQALRIPVEHAPTELEFSFCRSPGVTTHGPCGQVLTVAPGEFQVCSLRQRAHLSLQAVEDAVEHSIRLSLTESSLKQLLGSEQLPSELEGILSGEGIFSTGSYQVSEAISSTIDEIFEAVDSDTTGSALFVHAKAMELLALASDRLTPPADSPSSVSVEHLRRLHEARDILLAQIDSIPSIAELARRVRMGERQLKAGFKAVFGSPVVAYARKVRMERARRLLTDRRHNVTEVAQLMGYANPSKFAAAFRRQYGMSPSAA